jgi:type I restriction enzyme S subunit
MNKIELMITDLCPKGVEFKKLWEVIEIYTGSQFNKRDMENVGDYPVINGGIEASGYTDKFNENENTITVSQGGASAGFVNWVKTKFWAGAHCYVIRPKTEELNNRYLYFFLKDKQTQIMGSKHGAGIPGLNSDKIKKLEIPLPPLPIQQEIVNILDKFTALEAELEAELEARRKQYEYYRNALLTFTLPTLTYYNTINYKTTSEICKNIMSGKNNNRNENGCYPVYGSTGIIAYTDNYVYEKEQILVARVGANAGFVYIGYGKYDVSDNTLIVQNKEDEIILKFLYHLLINMNLNQFAKGGGQPLITAGLLKSIKIPILPLAEQNRIVAILDKFEKLVNDISEGLPAEIRMRQQQYEYYRNKLLTFDKYE